VKVEAVEVKPESVRLGSASAVVARRAAPWRGIGSAVFVVVALLWLTPAFWALATSLKITPNILLPTPYWLPIPATLDQYIEVLSGTRTVSASVAILNSAIVAILTTLASVVICTLTAYPLARMDFPGRNLIFGIIVGSMMVPGVITIVPLYLLMVKLGWLNSYQALIVPGVASAFGVFLLRQFFLSMPKELEDAAHIDGANSWQILTDLLLPLSKPALGALALFTFQATWNDFTWPLIVMTKQDRLTLPVALSLIRGDYSNDSFGPIMAGAVISAIPLLVVFIVANRQIIEGVQFSGLKM
jgi:multiple sugar transport system permease protein